MLETPFDGLLRSAHKLYIFQGEVLEKNSDTQFTEQVAGKIENLYGFQTLVCFLSTRFSLQVVRHRK